MMTTLFCGRPEQYAARTHHTLLQKHTLLRRGLGFRGVAEPLPGTAGFGFDVYKMLCYYPATCGLAVSSLSSLNSVAACSQATV